MPPRTLPPHPSIPTLPTSEQTHILDLLFEPSPSLHTLALPLLTSAPYPHYPALISAIEQRLLTLADSPSPSNVQILNEILGSHPRLGAPKVESAQSANEQKQLQGSEFEREKLRELNAEYEAKFPGLRYVVFVNGRGRDVIMEDMRERIAGGTLEGERRGAIKAMCEIAVDRASKLEVR